MEKRKNRPADEPEGSNKRSRRDPDAYALTRTPSTPPLSLEPVHQQAVATASFDWTPTFDRVNHSIVFVLIRPIPERFEKIQALADELETVECSRIRWRRVRRESTSTGFVYLIGPVGLLIMTSAQGLDHIFTASSPLTAATLDMFTINVVCDHQEREFQQAGARGHRKYGRARFLGHDCARDILLISIPNTEVKSFFGNKPCAQAHPALKIAESIRPAKPCMLISWPPHRPRTVAVGWSGSPRAYNVICWSNLVGYEMTLLEVNMTTDGRSSGAPLISTDDQVVGMFHVCLGHGHSYFVAAQHLRQMQQQQFAPARRHSQP